MLAPRPLSHVTAASPEDTIAPTQRYWVTRSSSCSLGKKKKKPVSKITRKVIFAVAPSGQITAQVGRRISAVPRGGGESVNGAEQKCFYKHERLRTCWPSQEWFTPVGPKEKQPQLMLLFIYFFLNRKHCFKSKNNDCQTAESEG